MLIAMKNMSCAELEMPAMNISAIVMMSCTCVRGTGVSVPKFLNALFEMQERGGCLHVYIVVFLSLNNDIMRMLRGW